MWFCAFGSFVVLSGLLLYLRGKDCNHTSFEPWLLSIIFGPAILLGIAAFPGGRSRWGALLTFCLGAGGMAFLFYIDHFNILVQYDRLGERGGL